MDLGEMKVVEFSPERCVVHNGGSDRAALAGGLVVLAAVLIVIANLVSPFVQDHLANVPWLFALLMAIAAFVYFFLRGEANTVTLSRADQSLHFENLQLYFWKSEFTVPLKDVSSFRCDASEKRKQLAILFQTGPVLFVGRETRAPGRVEAASALKLWLEEYERDEFRAQYQRDREMGLHSRFASGSGL